jgi:hypothetical protein
MPKSPPSRFSAMPGAVHSQPVSTSNAYAFDLRAGHPYPALAGADDAFQPAGPLLPVNTAVRETGRPFGLLYGALM